MFSFLFNRKTIYNIDHSSLKISQPRFEGDKCKVIDLVDGDTINILVKVKNKNLKHCLIFGKVSYFQKLRVRVDDIDAAEKSTYEGKIAEYLMFLLIESIPQNKLFFKSNPKDDKYGRTLGSLFIKINKGSSIEGYSSDEYSITQFLLGEKQYPLKNGEMKKGVIAVSYGGKTKTIDDREFIKEKKTVELTDEVKEKLREMYKDEIKALMKKI